MKTIAEGKRVVILENDGWEYVERKKGKEAVAVIAQDDRGRVILTEQFRKPVGKQVIDYPAGLVGDEEGTSDPAKTARKELEEETGFVCDEVELLAKGPTSAGITSELVSFYRARGVRKAGDEPQGARPARSLQLRQGSDRPFGRDRTSLQREPGESRRRGPHHHRRRHRVRH